MPRLLVPAFAWALAACAPMAGLESKARLIDPRPGSRYSVIVRSSSENTLGHQVEPVAFRQHGDSLSISYRRSGPLRAEIALAEDDTIRCILVARTYQEDGDHFYNGVTGEKFPFRVKGGVVHADGLAFRMDRSPQNRLDYNLAAIRRDIVLDTAEGVVAGTLDTLPSRTRFYVYPVSRRAGEEQPIEVKEKSFRFPLGSGVHAAYGKFISEYGWDYDFRIPVASGR